jgi:glyoxylase-like metal-dependent hydrolase (beta-lactamase superfamily II)
MQMTMRFMRDYPSVLFRVLGPTQPLPQGSRQHFDPRCGPRHRMHAAGDEDMTAMDGLEDAVNDEAPRPRLRYPFGDPPGAGEVREVAPGIHWLRMPLPFALQWINLWLIEDGDGYTIVDTGVAIEPAREHWRAVFAGLMQGRPVTRVICTHMHPDHLGLAGWITRKFDCRLWMSRLEYVTCRMLLADTGREAPAEGQKFYRAAGWDEDALDSYRVRFGGFGKAVSRLPDGFRRIEDGEVIRIGERDWHVITGSGHSPEHVCLWQKDLNVFISGDQVLPRISSNVSVFPTEPDGDPLSDWLSSCAKLRAIVDDDALVLPAHNEPFYGIHARLDNLVESHERALRRVRKRLEQSERRAIDLFGALFARKIGGDLLHMATGEALAHLNCLIERGEAVRVRGADGIDLYRAA